jgi:hypothetical protein
MWWNRWTNFIWTRRKKLSKFIVAFQYNYFYCIYLYKSRFFKLISIFLMVVLYLILSYCRIILLAIFWKLFNTSYFLYSTNINKKTRTIFVLYLCNSQKYVSEILIFTNANNLSKTLFLFLESTSIYVRRCTFLWWETYRLSETCDDWFFSKICHQISENYIRVKHWFKLCVGILYCTLCVNWFDLIELNKFVFNLLNNLLLIQYNRNIFQIFSQWNRCSLNAWLQHFKINKCSLWFGHLWLMTLIMRTNIYSMPIFTINAFPLFVEFVFKNYLDGDIEPLIIGRITCRLVKFSESDYIGQIYLR